ncbi:toxin glutamine deamidase domain-containing protein (plasmid) [Streptomyces sp. P8-A8]|uniref:toxin glutamine deamidase domain-containing protein n=1 Tax=Streptomyces sp. P8-A8 TaxID=3029759 RepID=UPI0036D9DE87
MPAQTALRESSYPEQDDLIAGRNPQPASGRARTTRSEDLEALKGRPLVFQSTRLSGVVTEVSLWGSGGRGFVAVTKGAGSVTGHVFNLVNVDGKVVFLDYQLGMARPEGWKEYFLMRTD